MLIVGLIIGVLIGHQIGCMRVGARMRQVAYLKEYDNQKEGSHYLGEAKAFREGMRYVVSEVTHDDLYYHGERPGV